MNKKKSDIILERGKPYLKEYRKVIAAIKKYDRIALFRHVTPDYDALGSQFGLMTWIKDNFPNKEVICLGDNHIAYSGRVYPEMQKYPQSWFDQPFLAIILDCPNTTRIADPRYKKAKYKIRIDHHPKVEDWGRVLLVDPNFVACGEFVCNLLLNLKGNYVFSKEAAYYFYTAIVGDSGSFKYLHTSDHTFAIAQKLVSFGIDIPEASQKMFCRLANDIDLKKYVINNYQKTEHGVVYYILPNSVLEELQVETEQGKDSLNIFANVDGINCWLSVTEDVTDHVFRYRVSIRSNTTPINQIASKYNGGGHFNAAGARLKKLEELPALVKDLDDLFK